MQGGRQLQGRLWWLFPPFFGLAAQYAVFWVLFVSKLPIAQWIASLPRSGTVVHALILLLKYLVCLLDTNKTRTCVKREQTVEGGLGNLLLTQGAPGSALFSHLSSL